MFKSDQLITADFEISAFKDLPLPFKKAIAWYMVVDGDAWEEVRDFADADFEEAAEMRAEFISEVDRLYGDVRFVHGTQSPENIMNVVLTDPVFAEDKTILDGRRQHEVQPFNERFPVIMADDNIEDPAAQTIQDGWTRLATYLTHQYDAIPIVLYEADHHAELLETLRRATPKP
jgi:hypothetical protein